MSTNKYEYTNKYRKFKTQYNCNQENNKLRNN